MTDLQKRVANGVAWLNENLGTDWSDFIDRENLNLENPGNCILGQTFDGGYLSVILAMGSDSEVSWSDDHGFSTVGSYAKLQKAWENYLDEYEILQEISA